MMFPKYKIYVYRKTNYGFLKIAKAFAENLDEARRIREELEKQGLHPCIDRIR